MTREIERLLVKVVGEGRSLTTTLGKADKETSDFSAKARTKLNAVTGSTLKLGAATAAALGGTAAAIYARTATDIDRIAKVGSKLNIPTKRLAGLELSAEKSGVQINQLNTGLQRMTRRIAEASRGTGEARGAITELGLDAQKLVNLRPDEQFERIADAMEGVGNQSDKVRLGFKLFDAEGVGLINTLDGGKKALRETQAEAERLGLALDEFDTGKVERANDAIKALERSTTGIARQFTAATAPLVEAIAVTFLDTQDDIRGWRTLFESTVDVLQAGAVLVAGAWIRINSAVSFTLGKIIQGFAAITGGIKNLFREAAIIEDALGVRGVGTIITEQLAGLESEAKLLGDTFVQEGIRSAGSLDRVTAALDKAITKARTARVVAKAPVAPPLPPPPPEDDKERERLAKELASLQRSLLGKRALIEADLEDRIGRAREFRANELLTEQEHATLIAALVFKAQSERSEIERREADERKKIAEDEAKKKLEVEKKARDNSFRIATSVAGGLTAIGDTIVSATGRQNKAALAAQKAFAIAAIAVNTAVGASRAIAELGPIAGPIAAAAIIAGGVASTARVLATGIGGTAALGGGGGRSAGAGGVGGIGDGDVCGAVSKVDQCRGGNKEPSDGRLGSANPVFQILQIGDDNVDRLIDQIKARVDGNDVLLFSGDSQQASEARG